MKLKHLSAAALMLLLSATVVAQQPTFFRPYKSSQLRLPSVPLLVNDPYFSFWSPFNKLTDGSVRHWSDAEKPIEGLLRVDGKSYRWMGNGQAFLLKAIAPMADANDSWTGRVSYTAQTGTAWTQRGFTDSSWEEEKAAWGTADEYPNVHNAWTATNSDIYVRRKVKLTADDLQKDLWIQLEREMKFYLTKLNTYGLPLDNRENYTKSDWVLWTAAMADDTDTFLKFSDLVWKYANETRTRWPLSDWYWTGNGEARGFRARSVIGGHWMKVLMDKY